VIGEQWFSGGGVDVPVEAERRSAKFVVGSMVEAVGEQGVEDESAKSRVR
jgi:hypothetical protein